MSRYSHTLGDEFYANYLKAFRDTLRSVDEENMGYAAGEFIDVYVLAHLERAMSILQSGGDRQHMAHHMNTAGIALKDALQGHKQRYYNTGSTAKRGREDDDSDYTPRQFRRME